MKKICVVVCCMLIACLAAAAQSGPTAMENQRHPSAAPQAGPVKHVLKNMYNNNCIATGCVGTAMVQGLNVLDAVTTVSCPGTTGTCLIQADQTVQADLVSGDAIAICLFVDGASVNGCYWNGGPGPFAYSTYSVSQGIVVNHGNHTVQTQAYSFLGGSLYTYYNSNYNVYKP